MKTLIFLFLSITSLRSAEVVLRLTNDGAFVVPNAALIAEFYNRGNDIVTVSVNGGASTNLVYPYKIAYTSKSVGQVNNFAVTTCDYLGRTAAWSFTTISQGRTFQKRKQ